MSVIIGCFCQRYDKDCWMCRATRDYERRGRRAYRNGWSRHRAPTSSPGLAPYWRRGWEKAQAKNPRARRS